MGESSLCSLFPHIYHLSSLKNCMVLDCVDSLVNPVSFSFGFRRNLTKYGSDGSGLSSFLA